MGVGLVEAILDDDNQFTTDVSGEVQNADGTRGIRLKSWFNKSVSGTWEGTITLQRSFDNGTTWLDVSELEDNVENYDQEIESNVIYRIGFKDGDYTSGEANVRLSK